MLLLSLLSLLLKRRKVRYAGYVKEEEKKTLPLFTCKGSGVLDGEARGSQAKPSQAQAQVAANRNVAQPLLWRGTCRICHVSRVTKVDSHDQEDITAPFAKHIAKTNLMK